MFDWPIWLEKTAEGFALVPGWVWYMVAFVAGFFAGRW